MPEETVEKMMAVTADQAVGTDLLPPPLNSRQKKERGYGVYHTSQLMGYSGLDKGGNRLGVTIDYPFFVLTIPERIDIARLCSPVFGVITGRQQRIAAMSWKVTRESKISDREAAMMKDAYSIFQEHKGQTDFRSVGVMLRCLVYLRRQLPDVLPDLSNFQRALLRWSRRVKAVSEDRCSEIEDWLQHPNEQDTFPDLTKKIVFDMHTHGGATPYKQYLEERLENIYRLPGGSIHPIRGITVGEATGFIQIIDGLQPQVYFGDEISYLWYAPRSDSAYGQLPLEALVNKVAEVLLFDQRAAEMADGTRPPDKLLAFGETTPFSGLGSEEMPVVGIGAPDEAPAMADGGEDLGDDDVVSCPMCHGEAVMSKREADLLAARAPSADILEAPTDPQIAEASTWFDFKDARGVVIEYGRTILAAYRASKQSLGLIRISLEHKELLLSSAEIALEKAEVRAEKAEAELQRLKASGQGMRDALEGLINVREGRCFETASFAWAAAYRSVGMLPPEGRAALDASPNSRASGQWMRDGAEAIRRERERQKSVEGWTPEHDDAHDDEELAQAGSAYAAGRADLFPKTWSIVWWKVPRKADGSIDRKRELEKAGALIAAEWDRLDRLEARAALGQGEGKADADPGAVGTE